MDIFLTTFQAVAVLLGVGLLGFWLISRRVLKNEAFDLLSPLAIDVSVPALVFSSIVSNFKPAQNPGWWLLPLWWLAFTALAGVLTASSSFVAAPGTKREFLVALFYQNGLFFPLIIIAGLFGGSSPYLADLFLFTLFYPVFFFNTWQFFFRGEQHRINWRRALNPILVATIIALAMVLIGIQHYLPAVISQMLTFVGAMATPVLMIILGGNIYTDLQTPSEWRLDEVAKFVVLKNIVFPLVTIGFLILVRPPYGVALIMLLQAAVPPITAVPIVVQQAGGNRSLVNQFMAASLLFSILTIPAMMALFGVFFVATK